MEKRLTRAEAMALAPVTRQARVTRSPKHTFQIRQRPFAITPFFIAPVLPGETLNFLLMQSRVVTEPIKSPILGMWMEYYLFYVKHRDLDISASLQTMMLDPDSPYTTVEASDDVTNYAAKGTVDWVHECLKVVTEEYFRDDGEAWDTWKIGSYLPAARVSGETWMQSLRDLATVSEADAELVLPVNATPDPDEVTVAGSDLDALMRQYELLRSYDLVNMSYEDWLMTHGVSVPKAEVHVPELIRYVRDWKTPANIVAADATPRYAISWNFAERADKRRRFQEPGFLFGVSVLRPKTYYMDQHGSAVGILNDAYSWLPAILHEDVGASLKSLSHTDLLLPDFTADFQIDVKDLFLYGDQFVNFDRTLVAGAVDLPASATNKRYPDGDDADSFFVTPATNNFALSDGVVQLGIAGHQRDTSP